ncbi:hypothetical protein IWQ60_011916, partial [Tieghemiomyces parasiticus]
LVGKSETELLLTLNDRKVEQANLRLQKAAGSGRRGAKTHEARKNIAHVLTVINQTQKAQLLEFCSTKEQRAPRPAPQVHSRHPSPCHRGPD